MGSLSGDSLNPGSFAVSNAPCDLTDEGPQASVGDSPLPLVFFLETLPHASWPKRREPGDPGGTGSWGVPGKAPPSKICPLER